MEDYIKKDLNSILDTEFFLTSGAGLQLIFAIEYVANNFIMDKAYTILTSENQDTNNNFKILSKEYTLRIDKLAGIHTLKLKTAKIKEHIFIPDSALRNKEIELFDYHVSSYANHLILGRGMKQEWDIDNINTMIDYQWQKKDFDDRSSGKELMQNGKKFSKDAFNILRKCYDVDKESFIRDLPQEKIDALEYLLNVYGKEHFNLPEIEFKKINT